MDQTDPDCPGETPPPVQRDAFADPPLEPSRRRQGGREEAAAPPHTLWWISTASLGEWYLPSSAELPGLAFRLVTSLSNPCSPSFLSSQTGFLSAPKASHGPYVYREVSYVLLCSKRFRSPYSVPGTDKKANRSPVLKGLTLLWESCTKNK